MVQAFTGKYIIPLIVAPIYQVIGRVLPPLGMIDLRPLVALVLIQFGSSTLVSLISRL